MIKRCSWCVRPQHGPNEISMLPLSLAFKRVGRVWGALVQINGQYPGYILFIPGQGLPSPWPNHQTKLSKFKVVTRLPSTPYSPKMPTAVSQLRLPLTSIDLIFSGGFRGAPSRWLPLLEIIILCWHGNSSHWNGISAIPLFTVPYCRPETHSMGIKQDREWERAGLGY